MAGYLDWFKAQGADRASMSNPLPGDLIIWGKNKHMGIYLGDGMAISALINPYGVKVHTSDGLHRHEGQDLPARQARALIRIRI